ncbi:alpha/beta hydrolase family protein [Streptomyces sp. NPDC021093]|uniref:alpha/beta hydrolase family protein n=1 Tax=Streptomyces sp. NPDC021093 TaxID=3365112 RepID=UPI00379DE6A4
MNRNRRLAASAAALIALTVAAPVAVAPAAFAAPDPQAPASASVRLQLPAPTGKFSVGRKDLHLVDRNRTDPWVPAAGARELMVSLYYPARKGTGTAASPYLKKEEARLLLEGIRRADEFPAELLTGAGTNSRTDARPLGGKHPLVLLSPGFTLHRSTLTGLAEELASRGYVVATMDHAYESFGTEFPGGRVLGLKAGLAKDVLPVRAADASFVLDRLLDPKGGFAQYVDRRRIGMAGHSIGGNSSAFAMAGDARIKAGANLDGGFFDDAPGAGLNGRPFLLLGTDATHRPGGKGKWGEAWTALDGWKRWLTVAGSGHFSFNDIPVLGGQLGVVDPSAPLSGKRSGEITLGYVGAFFDLQLKGRQTPLFDGPTEADPEVSFHSP